MKIRSEAGTFDESCRDGFTPIQISQCPNTRIRIQLRPKDIVHVGPMTLSFETLGDVPAQSVLSEGDTESEQDSPVPQSPSVKEEDSVPRTKLIQVPYIAPTSVSHQSEGPNPLCTSRSIMDTIDINDPTEFAMTDNDTTNVLDDQNQDTASLPDRSSYRERPSEALDEEGFQSTAEIHSDQDGMTADPVNISLPTINGVPENVSESTGLQVSEKAKSPPKAHSTTLEYLQSQQDSFGPNSGETSFHTEDTVLVPAAKVRLSKKISSPLIIHPRYLENCVSGQATIDACSTSNTMSVKRTLQQPDILAEKTRPASPTNSKRQEVHHSPSHQPEEETQNSMLESIIVHVPSKTTDVDEGQAQGVTDLAIDLNQAHNTTSPAKRLDKGHVDNVADSTAHVDQSEADNAADSKVRDIECAPAKVSGKKRKRSTANTIDTATASPPQSSARSTRSSVAREDVALTEGGVSKIVFASSSSVKSSAAFKKFLKSHGVTMVDNIREVTALCVGKGELKKTSKMIMAVLLGKRIITDDWVTGALLRSLCELMGIIILIKEM